MDHNCRVTLGGVDHERVRNHINHGERNKSHGSTSPVWQRLPCNESLFKHRLRLGVVRNAVDGRTNEGKASIA